jgi:TldD protein
MQIEIKDSQQTVDFSSSEGAALRTRFNAHWRRDTFSAWETLRQHIPSIAAYAQPYPIMQQTEPTIMHEYTLSLPQLPDVEDICTQLQEHVGYIRRMPNLCSVQARFFYDLRQTYIIDSNGTFIISENPCYWMVFLGVTSDTHQTNLLYISGRDINDFGGKFVKIRENLQTWQQASAPPVRQGRYPVVLDPALTGIFVHEGFGHLREADNLSAGLGSSLEAYRVGIKDLNIVDDGTCCDLVGGYAYDDEGTPASKTQLVDNGILCGRLHTRTTAAHRQEAPTGNGRTASYQDSVMPRMSCTYMETGQTDVTHLFDGIEVGLYASGVKGGATNGQVFVFVPQQTYMIRQGQLAEPVSNVVLTGEIFKTLCNIEAIGNDFEWALGASCTKAQQFIPRISWGGPHIRISDVTVGGLS